MHRRVVIFLVSARDKLFVSAVVVVVVVVRVVVRVGVVTVVVVRVVVVVVMVVRAVVVVAYHLCCYIPIPASPRRKRCIPTGKKAWNGVLVGWGWLWYGSGYDSGMIRV